MDIKKNMLDVLTNPYVIAFLLVVAFLSFLFIWYVATGSPEPSELIRY